MSDRYQDSFTNMTVDDYIKQLEACGWFAEIPASAQEPLLHEIRTMFAQDPRNTFLGLSTVTFDSEYIMDCGPGEESYYDLLLKFAEGSYGQFSPTEIRDELVSDPRGILVGFRHGGNDYRCIVDDTDWFQFEVLDLINQALAESDVPQRFFDLPQIDQFLYITFVTPRTFLSAQRRDLIPPPEYFDEDHDEDGDMEQYLADYYAALDVATEPII